VKSKFSKPKTSCDVLILGAGVIGLSTGIALLESRSGIKVIICEKEAALAQHASGRNSGVLHAGFYYSPDSLKAKFCKDGNSEIRKLAKKYSIPVKNVGKVVVARNFDENIRLGNLFERGEKNGIDIELLDVSRLNKIEPLAVTHERFLWSPTTGVSDPIAIINALYDEFITLGGIVVFNTNVVLSNSNNEVIDSTNQFNASFIVNTAGAQADKISRKIGVGIEYSMVPFMGVYKATLSHSLPLRTLVYPVPHPINPFLGVHFTLTIDNKVKIGPTAIPIVGREQYSLFSGWSVSDSFEAFKGIKALIKGNSHNFGEILTMEIPKFIEKQLVRESCKLVPAASQVTKWFRKPPGIRAQLVNTDTGVLEQDFVLKTMHNSLHVLNCVSPGWTCAIPFGKFISSQVKL